MCHFLPPPLFRTPSRQTVPRNSARGGCIRRYPFVGFPLASHTSSPAHQRASVVFTAKSTLVPPPYPFNCCPRRQKRIGHSPYRRRTDRKRGTDKTTAKMAYFHGHMQTLQKDYPPFNYAEDEVRIVSTRPASLQKRSQFSTACSLTLLHHTAQKLRVGKLKTNLTTPSSPETVSEGEPHSPFSTVVHFGSR